MLAYGPEDNKFIRSTYILHSYSHVHAAHCTSLWVNLDSYFEDQILYILYVSIQVIGTCTFYVKSEDSSCFALLSFL